jgi:tripartite-type tricarboxylate transporter receptor subunit TctC
MRKLILGKTLVAAALVAATASFSSAFAQQWKPERPIKVVVPFGAGGTTDVMVRVLLKKIEEKTGWTMIVDNKVGASGAIGSLEVKNAKPDGHVIGVSATLLYALDPFVPGVNVGYKPEDFDYLGTMGLIEFGVVAPKDAPFNDLKEMAEYSKKKKIRFVSQGRPLELSMELMSKKFGIEYVTATTSGSAESLQLVAGGHADLAMDGGLHVSFIRDGKVKPVAILANKRPSYAPDTKTIIEQGAPLPMRNYVLFFTPLGMPANVKAALAQAIDDGMKTPEMREHMGKIFMGVDNLGPDKAKADVLEQAAHWKEYFANKK